MINCPRIAVFEFAPAHGLPKGRRREYLAHGLAAQILQALDLQLLLIQRTNKHEIGELLDDGQRVGDAASPNIRLNFIDFVFDDSGNHG